MTSPITPQEVAAEKARTFPAAVFEVFNALIAASFVGDKATIRQSDVMRRLADAGIAQSDVHRNGYLNVEEAYRAAGWHVTYDKPGYNEEGHALFIFERPKS